MNREIKFRGWDKEQTKMLTHEEIDELDKGGIAHWMDIIKPNNREGVDVMQYTGLKDKNGKEVYDGDICRDDDGRIYEVLSKPGYFSFAGGVMGCGDLAQSQMLIEVIGNIYENPELLNNVLNVQGSVATDVK